jgi:hypothetical protein
VAANRLRDHKRSACGRDLVEGEWRGLEKTGIRHQ